LPFQLSTREAFERVATALEELPLLLLKERSEIAGVVEAVIHEGPSRLSLASAMSGKCCSTPMFRVVEHLIL